ncbi:hypothetical protein [Bacillus phage CP-51]|uniref:Uncharacterized protein n=1 Tax=Bacillus phage CP-51 TaxID=1391188 RepID=A0A068EU71_9CAUD|nr:hypothetical protein OZ73_gp126 [Bacillus phage CP-51]AID50561.1 hypothetical protein [Bacillus phage CP-51]
MGKITKVTYDWSIDKYSRDKTHRLMKKLSKLAIKQPNNPNNRQLRQMLSLTGGSYAKVLCYIKWARAKREGNN